MQWQNIKLSLEKDKKCVSMNKEKKSQQEPQFYRNKRRFGQVGLLTPTPLSKHIEHTYKVKTLLKLHSSEWQSD